MHTSEDIFNSLREEIDKTSGPIAIQAGHFAIIPDVTQQRLIPGIFNDIPDAELRTSVEAQPYMGHFPIESWKAGVALLRYAKSKQKKAYLVLIVNDWQWVPNQSNTYTSLRENFKKEFQIPPSFHKILYDNACDETDILPMQNNEGKIYHPLYFSEVKLRKMYTQKYSTTCDLGSNLCAREYVPLLMQLCQKNISLFISFVPKTCQGPINIGSKETKEKLDVPISIINIFTHGISAESFWKNIDIKPI